MEASALTHASRRGLLARRSPLLKLERDERLVALIRAGHDRAFEVLFDRYHSRLLSFCRSMLKSQQDAEDVLQDVFVNAHAAMVADERKINVRPWLYRIARNRCLNHLRKPGAEGQDSMDVHVHEHGTTTAERVQRREELRHLLADVQTLPETQRTALLLREVDQLSYEEIAQAMETTVPAVKSLLVRARITLAESSESRQLTCDEVRVDLAEAAEGISKASGPVRLHVRACDGCRDFRGQLRSDRKALAALFPIGPLALLKGGLLAKIFGGAGSGGAAAGSGGAAGSGAVGSAAASGTAAAGGIASGIGGAIGTKAAAGVATAALLTAGAVEVKRSVGGGEDPVPTPIERATTPPSPVADVAPSRQPRAEQGLRFAASTTPATAERRDQAEPNEASQAAEPADDAPATGSGAGKPEEQSAEPEAAEPPVEQEGVSGGTAPGFENDVAGGDEAGQSGRPSGDGAEPDGEGETTSEPADPPADDPSTGSAPLADPMQPTEDALGD